MHQVPVVTQEDIESLRRAKWDRGVAEHGPVMVLDPLVEALPEALDLINYAEECAADSRFPLEDREVFTAIATQARRTAKVLLFMQRKHAALPWQPKVLEFK